MIVFQTLFEKGRQVKNKGKKKVISRGIYLICKMIHVWPTFRWRTLLKRKASKVFSWTAPVYIDNSLLSHGAGIMKGLVKKSHHVVMQRYGLHLLSVVLLCV